jgi:hypothetical protein
MKTQLFVLGARDVEMIHIENILSLHGERYVYALSPNGERVSPRNASSGEWIIDDPTIDLVDVDEIVLIELTPPKDWPYGSKTIVLDHHSEGSIPFPSIFQLCTYLVSGIEGLICGCADHDLRIAYKAFDPAKVLDFRRRSLNLSTGDLEAAKAAVERAPLVGGVRIVSDSPNPLVGDILLSRSEMGLVCIPSDKEGVRKWSFSGAIAQEIAETIINNARAQGLEHYWFPTRGVGGVYCDDPTSLIDEQS